jgi:hypothetical protein
MKPKPKRKRCPSCHERKSLDAFYPHQRSVDGCKAWCKVCLDFLERATGPAKLRLRRAYKRDRSRSYQYWYRSTRGMIVFDRRVASRDTRAYYLRWSRTSGVLMVRTVWPEVEKVRRFMTRYFDCDPTGLSESGRGGGSGVRRQPVAFVEGGVDEEAWNEGLAALKADGWNVARKAHSDVTATNV